jgi:hypothetical protein
MNAASDSANAITELGTGARTLLSSRAFWASGFLPTDRRLDTVARLDVEPATLNPQN